MNGNRKTRLLLAALVAAAALALAACGTEEDVGNPESNLSLEEAQAPLEGGSPELTSLRDEANELLGGGSDAFNDRLDELKGTPVVVNKWASWCGPCRFEFPVLQSQAIKRADEVAFLGVGSNDSKAAMSTFLEQLPLPYPTYVDPDQEIARQLGGTASAFPATAFYDSSGELVFTHNGQYTSEEDLAGDIDKYAK